MRRLFSSLLILLLGLPLVAKSAAFVAGQAGPRGTVFIAPLVVTNAPAEFSPPDPGNLVLWVRPEELASFANNDPVVTWTNNGVGDPMISPGGGFTPICVTASLNGWRGVQFDGSDRLEALVPTTSTKYTMIAVVKFASAAGSGCFLRIGNDTGGYGFLKLSGNRSIIHRAVAACDDGTATTSAEMWSATRIEGPDLVTFWLNGAAETVSNDTSGVNTPDDFMILGDFSFTAPVPFTGILWEVFVWDEPLADLSRETVEAYLDAKFFP